MWFLPLLCGRNARAKNMARKIKTWHRNTQIVDLIDGVGAYCHTQIYIRDTPLNVGEVQGHIYIVELE